MIKEKETIKVNGSFIKQALRSAGHDNYTAILDIIDNSVEEYVHSSFVKVDFEMGDN